MRHLGGKKVISGIMIRKTKTGVNIGPLNSFDFFSLVYIYVSNCYVLILNG